VPPPASSRPTSPSGRASGVRQQAFDDLGEVDAVINNVGDVAREQMSWRDLTEESVDHVLAVDIKGTMACTHEFGARMLDQGSAPIVNIGSTVIVRGSARAPQYAAAKYGILGLTKSYAHAFAPTVRVNVFAPASSRPRPRSAARTGRRAAATSCGHDADEAGSPARTSWPAPPCSSPPTTRRT
jgi:NAD(P)-dependent dehydrogenase (short-subunit alcohol dehydrogenase family)